MFAMPDNTVDTKVDSFKSLLKCFISAIQPCVLNLTLMDIMGQVSVL